MKKTAEEIRSLAVAFMKAGHLVQAERLFLANEAMRLVKAEEEESSYQAMEAYLNANLSRFAKDKQGAWWDPPRNYVINSAIMGLNTWRFGILPMFAEKMAYRPANPEREQLEGLVIDPSWKPTGSSDPTGGNTVDHSLKVAEILTKYTKGQPSVQDTVKNELRWVESKFGVKIPSSVEASLVKDAAKVATRRWGVNRLRTKKILVPFDGSKAQELSNW